MKNDDEEAESEKDDEPANFVLFWESSNGLQTLLGLHIPLVALVYMAEAFYHSYQQQ